jgi:choline dehydrogenase-like flavoprotein
VQLLPVRRLADVFATFSPMSDADALRRAVAAIETLRATRSRRDVAELGLALRALDLAPLNAALGAGLSTFGGGSQEARERILRAWSASPIPQLRTAFQAMKRLGLFLAYADPGPDPAMPSNEGWERIGYAPPDPATDAGPSSVIPLIVGRSEADPLRLDADVVVIGSGAGGGILAARLAAAGRSVLVLEMATARAGEHLPRLEAEAWRDLYLDRGATSTHDLSLTILAGSALGGGTTVNWTTSIAPPDWLRAEWEEEHGLAGMTGRTVDEDIGRLRTELGVMGPSVVPPKDRAILNGCAALGWEAAPNERNAGPCDRCGACGFGCPWGSKRSTLTVHLPMAQAAGARILDGARVTRIISVSGRVRGVHGRLAGGGRRFIVHAAQVLLAAGALRTPALLALSGVAHPELGRHLRLHPVAVIAADMPEPVDMWLGPTQAARSLEFALPGRAALTGIGPPHGGFIVESAPAHPGFAAAALPWEGRDAGAVRLARLRHLAPLVAIVRERGSGRVRPSAGGRVRIDYRLAPEDEATVRRAYVEMARIGRAAGATELLAVATPGITWNRGDDFDAYLRRLAAIDLAPNRAMLFSAHQMGSARAGADPARAPVDPDGRVRLDRHGGLLRGAYVADASLFPTPSGVNPMLTIMVLAERVARTVIAEGR